MPKTFFGSERFKWGISIDNMWNYAGTEAPKSIIVPYLISFRLPRGPFRASPDVDPDIIKAELEKESRDSPNFDHKALCVEIAEELKLRDIDFVRCWFQWNFFEPRIVSKEESDYQFPLDDFVLEMKTHGIEIVAVLASGYSRFLPQGLNMENSKEYTRKMVSMAEAVVRHYKESISVWQIENEPNWWDEHYATHWRSGGMWLESGIQALILKNLRDTVKNTDPNATVVINLEADNRKTSWKFFSNYCDVLGLDFYPNYLHSSPVDAAELKFASIVRQETGLPLFVAETGYPSGPSLFGYDATKQAEYVRSACIESFGCDAITGLSIWRYSDSYWKSFPLQENYFGLLTKEGQPKPAWIEYYNQIKQHH